MYTKEKIFNLALGALLLQRQINNAETEKSNEANVLRSHWEVALFSTLEDLDLDETSSPVPLELIDVYPNAQWNFVYKYPTNCAFFRRVQSCFVMDNRTTHISKRVGVYTKDGLTLKAIFTNKENAVGECVMKDIPLSILSANAGIAVYLKLAMLSSALVVGKGAARLIKDIETRYVIAKSKAQEKDSRENFNFESDALQSEFVEARTT